MRGSWWKKYGSFIPSMSCALKVNNLILNLYHFIYRKWQRYGRLFECQLFQGTLFHQSGAAYRQSEALINYLQGRNFGGREEILADLADWFKNFFPPKISNPPKLIWSTAIRLAANRIRFGGWANQPKFLPFEVNKHPISAKRVKLIRAGVANRAGTFIVKSYSTGVLVRAGAANQSGALI